MSVLQGRRWWLAWVLVLVGSLVVLVPSVGDYGLTYDEPAYRYSQECSIQWWEQLGNARGAADLARVLDPDALLYYWPYARHGINFHPPLGGQLNLLTYALSGRWVRDIPARRLASAFELAFVVAMVFGFLAHRYGIWAGLGAVGAILFSPRLYGQAHLIDTDTPGVLVWTAGALAFWKGLNEPQGRRWRVAVGVLAGLAFVEKMATVFFLLPALVWLVVARLPRARRADWIDGIVTTIAQLAPLAIVFREILRLTTPPSIWAPAPLPLPQHTNLFLIHPQSNLPGAILLVPLLVWFSRRVLGRIRRGSPVWGVERPVLEIWSAILAFGPAVGWLGNPAWWRETLPRLAHYYMLTTARRGTLPDIRILYLGQTYIYSLPWHNAWVLLAITVPVSLLIATIAGLAFAARRIAGRDLLPLYVFLHLCTLPLFRMFPTPAHDGVRLFLPTFVFLAILAGWGIAWAGDGLAQLAPRGATAFRFAVLVTALVPAVWQLAKIHPYELSYYNELIGGPRGAWKAGFELSYWYDAFTPGIIRELNEHLPHGAAVTFANELSAPEMVFPGLQSLGELRGDLYLGVRPGAFPYLWLLTHDSKADSFTRLLFLMRPWFASSPRQLDGLRVVTVADPVAASRAWALQLLTDGDTAPDDNRPASPAWVRQHVPMLARFWGDGVTKCPRLSINEPIFEWAWRDPDSLRAAARALISGDPLDAPAKRLLEQIQRDSARADVLFRNRPRALIEAVEILITHGDAIRQALLRYPYTAPEDLGGYLDRDLPEIAANNH